MALVLAEPAWFSRPAEEKKYRIPEETQNIRGTFIATIFVTIFTALVAIPSSLVDWHATPLSMGCQISVLCGLAGCRCGGLRAIS
ncbi:hypothetical protein [Demequina soli]|uniref:hypothetical protein n=1 Tax=Demequina soli TaxID=1638987 RepID=UPI001E42E8D9|nr:hypothetical protein [Demequina soli]